MITVSVTGSTKKTEEFLRKLKSGDIYKGVEELAREGVAALAAATPTDSRLAASSWGFEVVRSGRSLTIKWTNTDVENGFPVVIMLQYGHGTGTGGYVQGRDFINPAIKPIFDRIENHVWKAVTSA